MFWETKDKKDFFFLLLQAHFISIIPPRDDWFLLNTDDTVKGNLGQAGGSETLRNHRGAILSAFIEYYGYCSSLKV